MGVVLLLIACGWYDKIASMAQHVLNVPNAAPLEAGIAGPAPPPTSLVFDGVRDKGKGMVEMVTMVGSALGALAVGLGKLLDVLNKGAEA